MRMLWKDARLVVLMLAAVVAHASVAAASPRLSDERMIFQAKPRTALSHRPSLTHTPRCEWSTTVGTWGCMRDVKEVHSTVCGRCPSAFLCVKKGGGWTYGREVRLPGIRRISAMTWAVFG